MFNKSNIQDNTRDSGISTFKKLKGKQDRLSNCACKFLLKSMGIEYLNLCKKYGIQTYSTIQNQPTSKDIISQYRKKLTTKQLDPGNL